MKRVYGFNCGMAAAFFLLSGGCAVLPVKSHADLKPNSVVGERDALAAAADGVEAAPWPKPEPVSFISRIAGGSSGERVTRSDAIAAYVDALYVNEGRLTKLLSDARNNLARAAELDELAQAAAFAPRLSVNDIAILESAIQTLREHRQIYAAAARELAKRGEYVDPSQIDAIRDAYQNAIRALGETADQLAERIENDRSETYAAPDRSIVTNYSGI